MPKKKILPSQKKSRFVFFHQLQSMNHYVIQPDSSFLAVWKLLTTLSLLLQFTLVPIHVVFAFDTPCKLTRTKTGMNDSYNLLRNSFRYISRDRYQLSGWLYYGRRYFHIAQYCYYPGMNIAFFHWLVFEIQPLLSGGSCRAQPECHSTTIFKELLCSAFRCVFSIRADLSFFMGDLGPDVEVGQTAHEWRPCFDILYTDYWDSTICWFVWTSTAILSCLSDDGSVPCYVSQLYYSHLCASSIRFPSFTSLVQ